jgi:glycosyltransferase involved in cell wall biosynthesis
MREFLKIIHLSNNYTGSAVHKNLNIELDNLNIEQQIYSPIRDNKLNNKNKFEFRHPNSKIVYSHILNLYTRINYKAKIRYLLADLEEKIDTKNNQITHAHTWFSDGGVAYELKKKYNIPYIVAIRNVDLNTFFKYMLHLRSYGKEILQYAERIIFISPVYKNRLLNHSYFKNIKSDIEKKALIIPNGIDSFWIKNQRLKTKEIIEKPYQLLFVGSLEKDKNVKSIQKAVIKLNKKEITYQLNIVGDGGNDEKKIIETVNNRPDMFNYFGKITDQNRLLDIYRKNHLFIMPSKHETFGLVYIEALSQNLPVIYTKNEGIYGLYDHTIGENVDCNSIQNICYAIEKICKNYDEYQFDSSTILKNHNWKLIALKYMDIYNAII